LDFSGLVFFRRQRQHRAPALRRAAQAFVLVAQRARNALVYHQAIVIEELFASWDVAQGDDIHGLARGAFLRLAVRRTGVVDPARIIAALAAIDHLAAAQREEEGMKWIIGVYREHCISLFRRNALPAVLKNVCARGDIRGGEDPVAVECGLPDCVPSGKRACHKRRNSGLRVKEYKLERS